MNIVGPSLSAGLAALQALAEPPAPNAAPSTPPSAQVLTGASRTTLSSAAADAVLGLNIAAPGAPATASYRANEAYARAAIPADRSAWLETLGADAWSLREPATLDDAAFAAKALDSMIRSGSAKLPGFAEARANGTLRIHRAADMPDLGYRSYQLTLYKEGAAFGGVGFGTMDTDRWMELRRSGIFAVTGSVGGNDYVATWPLAWDGEGAGDDTAPQRAA